MALIEEIEKQGNWLFKYRSYIPFSLLFIGFCVFIKVKLGQNNWILESEQFHFIWEMLCLAISLMGLGIRIFTVGYTPVNTSGRNTEKQDADSLNTTGIYSLVRHPLYHGNFFMWWGISLLTASFWFNITFILFYWLYYERIMFAEEQFLRDKFGDEYLSWAEITPAFLPKFKGYIKPNIQFSWKKIFKKEKDGIDGMVILFCFFDTIGQLIDKHSIVNYNFIYVTLMIMFLHVVLTFIKRKTKLLDEVGR